MVPRYTWSAHSLPVSSVTVTSGGCSSRVITSSLDRKVIMWDLPSGKQLQTVLCPSFITCVAIDNCETKMYLGGGDGKVYVVNLAAYAVNGSAVINAAQAHVKDISNAGSKSAASTSELGVLIGHEKTVTCMAISLDGKLLYTGSDDGTVRVWDTDSHRTLRTFKGHTGAITSLFLVPTPPLFKDVDGAAALAPIAPFKKFQTTVTGTASFSSVLSAPLLLHRDNQQSLSDAPLSQSSSSYKKRSWVEMAGSAPQEKEGGDRTISSTEAAVSGDDKDKEIKALKEQVASLEGANARWQAVSEKLSSIAMNSGGASKPLEIKPAKDKKTGK